MLLQAWFHSNPWAFIPHHCPSLCQYPVISPLWLSTIQPSAYPSLGRTGSRFRREIQTSLSPAVISFFWSLSRSCDYRWVLEQRWPSKLKALPSGSAPFPPQGTITLITADKAPIHLSISRSNLPSLMNKIPDTQNSSTRGRDSSTTRREHSIFFFLVENHGLGFGGTDFHPNCFTLLQTSLVRAESLGLKKQTESSSAKSRGSQTRRPPLHDYTLRSFTWKSQTVLWQETALVESNTHCKRVWLSGKNAI